MNSIDIGNGQALKVLGFVYRNKMSYTTFCIQGKGRPVRLRNFKIHSNRNEEETELFYYANRRGYI